MAVGLFRRRVFRHPFRRVTESVGLHSVIFALISGPFYYWRKRARIEAVLLFTAGVPLMVYHPGHAMVSRWVLSDAATVVWAAAAVLAPLVLALSYRRQGWSEIDDPD
jgi:hypothetical protein